MDNPRYEWRNLSGGLCWIEIGSYGNGKDYAEVWSSPDVGPAAMADEILRLAARLREAEELLADPDLQWGGGSWIDFGTCPLCGGRRPGGGKPAGHVPSCRLHAFLASGKEGA